MIHHNSTTAIVLACDDGYAIHAGVTTRLFVRKFPFLLAAFRQRSEQNLIGLPRDFDGTSTPQCWQEDIRLPPAEDTAAPGTCTEGVRVMTAPRSLDVGQAQNAGRRSKGQS
jgi:hypothetical protein